MDHTSSTAAFFSRRRFLQLAGVGAASVTLGGVLSACSASGAQAPDAAQDAAQVVVAMNTNSEPAAGFDPFVSWGCGEHVHEPLIQSTLITTDENLAFKGDLATEYHCSSDGMIWTFTLRDDVHFTNGAPLSAQDVAFTINGIIASEAAEADLSMVEKALVINDTTLEVHMLKPYNALLYTLAVVGIVPQGAHDSGYGDNPIGSGRYMLEQWDKGQQIILVANPNYYGEAPKMQRVIVVFMAEDAALAAAKAGQVDIAFTSATYSNQRVEGCDLFACKTVDSRGISLPTGAPGATKADKGNEYPAGNAVTSDVAVRRAINVGVDRQLMIDNVLNGYGSPAYSVSDNMPWSSADMKVKTDVEAAKKMLEDAGWVAGADGIRVKDGTRAAFNTYYSSDDSVRQALTAEFANQMKGLGIEVSIKGASWDDIYPHEFSDTILWGWGSNSVTEVYELNYSTGWGNFPSYENAAIDGYLDAALATPKIEDSYPLWHKAQWDGTQGVAPQGAATWVWLANVDHLYFKQKKLHVANQKPHPHGHGWSLVNNVDQWSWL
ncbi:MAG: ABC transporter substrate-binding protein [Raoultibacter sp.]